MRVFLDTNVLLDVLAKREPFYSDSARVWTLSETRGIEGVVSTLSFANVFYIVGRLEDGRAARKAIRLLREAFTPVAFDENVLRQAMDAEIEDFEDAIQFFSAVRSRSKCLVTRNPSHFPSGGPAVLVPAEFLAAYFP